MPGLRVALPSSKNRAIPCRLGRRTLMEDANTPREAVAAGTVDIIVARNYRELEATGSPGPG